MKTVSITQAKNNLSALLDAVRHGEIIIITDRNRSVARIDSVLEYQADDSSGRVARLERQGIMLRPSKSFDLSLLDCDLPTTTGMASAVDMLLREREDDR